MEPLKFPAKLLPFAWGTVNVNDGSIEAWLAACGGCGGGRRVGGLRYMVRHRVRDHGTDSGVSRRAGEITTLERARNERHSG